MKVDVKDEKCKSRPCYQLGFDKGTYVQGKGYTSYYKKERPVCWTRFLRGCPINAVCPNCRLSSVDVGVKCSGCGQALTVAALDAAKAEGAKEAKP